MALGGVGHELRLDRARLARLASLGIAAGRPTERSRTAPAPTSGIGWASALGGCVARLLARSPSVARSSVFRGCRTWFSFPLESGGLADASVKLSGCPCMRALESKGAAGTQTGADPPHDLPLCFISPC